MKDTRKPGYDFETKSSDIPLKDFWRDNERFASLFNDVLFGGKKCVKPENLKETDTEVSTSMLSVEFRRLLKRNRDVVKESSDGYRCMILGIENQEAIHYAMPIRIFVYEMLSYLRQIEERTRDVRKNKKYDDRWEFLSGWKREDRLMPCYTLVVYWGEKPWDGPRNMAEMMDNSEPWMAEMFQRYPPMNLLCVNEIGDGGYELRNKDVRDVFHTVAALYQSGGKDMPESLSDVSMDVAFTAAAVTKTMKQYRKILEEVYKSGKESVNMCEAVERALHEREAIGIEIGMEKGMEKGKYETLCDLINKGILTLSQAAANENLAPENFLMKLKEHNLKLQ